MSTTTNNAAAKSGRLNDLETILEDRRRELVRDLHARIRAVRSDGITERDVIDDAESSEVDIQDDIGFAVLQLKAETLKKIEAALRRIEDGEYGDCVECGGEIADARLRALPFAMRCRGCEAERETIARRESAMAYRGPAALFVDVSS